MVILVAHGSHNAEWRASVEAVIEPLRAELGRDAVRLAYMDCTPPTLHDVVADAARAGYRRVRVLPLFLTTEGHVDRDIRPMVGEAQRSQRGIDVELLMPVGQHPRFAGLLRDIVLEGDRDAER